MHTPSHPSIFRGYATPCGRQGLFSPVHRAVVRPFQGSVAPMPYPVLVKPQPVRKGG